MGLSWPFAKHAFHRNSRRAYPAAALGLDHRVALGRTEPVPQLLQSHPERLARLFTGYPRIAARCSGVSLSW